MEKEKVVDVEAVKVEEPKKKDKREHIIGEDAKHSLYCNPKSKHYNKHIAKRRAKEKNRRAVNAKKRK